LASCLGQVNARGRSVTFRPRRHTISSSRIPQNRR
jgi:hypothetical protein